MVHVLAQIYCPRGHGCLSLAAVPYNKLPAICTRTLSMYRNKSRVGAREGTLCTSAHFTRAEECEPAFNYILDNYRFFKLHKVALSEHFHIKAGPKIRVEFYSHCARK